MCGFITVHLQSLVHRVGWVNNAMSSLVVVIDDTADYVMRESSRTQLNQNRWYILKLEQKKTTFFGQKWPS
jgi:hypothetical protein